jgi:predicted secreted protein
VEIRIIRDLKKMTDELKTINLLGTAEVRVSPGDSVKVEVPAKGATGHVWSIQADPKDVRVLGHTKQPSELTFGGGGVEVFTLQPMHEGRAEIRFQLGAPWKKEPAEEHTLSIDVSKSERAP